MIASWLSKRGLIAASIVGVIAAYPALAGGSYVEGAITIVVSGLFWGWILTKWCGRWFAGEKK